MNYVELLKINKELKGKNKTKPFVIQVLSNAIVSQFKEILEYYTRIKGINSEVEIGNYDNIVQDSQLIDNRIGAVCIFYELSNLIDGFQYKVETFDDKEIENIVERVKKELDLIITNLASCPLIIFNKFSTLVFNHQQINSNKFDLVCNAVNNYLLSIKPRNMVIIETDKVLATISVAKSVDFRYFYSSKSLYTIDFYKEYANFISPVLASLQGFSKKALILDCDNTLWSGIIGEDGLSGIKMNSSSKKGIVYEEVQYIAKALNNKGIILGLCSKNNFKDVEEGFNVNNGILKFDDFTIKKINWENKDSNLKKIAEELNIGLDSIVFVDDSDFEVNLIKELLPSVEVIHVPEKSHLYPSLIRAQSALFFNLSNTDEDKVKVLQYQQQMEREKIKENSSSMEEYIKSLDLEVIFFTDEPSHVSRISQLSQKTNQFNLTTKRYSETQIEAFMNSKDSTVISIQVKDKYGDYGLTGLCILQFDQKTKHAGIDTFLMSCRIIGRKIEIVLFSYLLSYLKKLEMEKLTASYIPTLKNTQVENFYLEQGMSLTTESEKCKEYDLSIPKFNLTKLNLNYIKSTIR